MKTLRNVAVAAFAVAAVAFGAAPAMADAAHPHFVFVSHAPDSDSWWNTIKNALKNSEHDLGVKVEYRNPSTGDTGHFRLISQASVTMKVARFINPCYV